MDIYSFFNATANAIHLDEATNTAKTSTAGGRTRKDFKFCLRKLGH